MGVFKFPVRIKFFPGLRLPHRSNIACHLIQHCWFYLKKLFVDDLLILIFRIFLRWGTDMAFKTWENIRGIQYLTGFGMVQKATGRGKSQGRKVVRIWARRGRRPGLSFREIGEKPPNSVVFRVEMSRKFQIHKSYSSIMFCTVLYIFPISKFMYIQKFYILFSS